MENKAIRRIFKIKQSNKASLIYFILSFIIFLLILLTYLDKKQTDFIKKEAELFFQDSKKIFTEIINNNNKKTKEIIDYSLLNQEKYDLLLMFIEIDNIITNDSNTDYKSIISEKIYKYFQNIPEIKKLELLKNNNYFVINKNLESSEITLEEHSVTVLQPIWYEMQSGFYPIEGTDEVFKNSLEGAIYIRKNSKEHIGISMFFHKPYEPQKSNLKSIYNQHSLNNKTHEAFIKQLQKEIQKIYEEMEKLYKKTMYEKITIILLIFIFIISSYYLPKEIQKSSQKDFIERKVETEYQQETSSPALSLSTSLKFSQHACATLLLSAKNRSGITWETYTNPESDSIFIFKIVSNGLPDSIVAELTDAIKKRMESNISAYTSFHGNINLIEDLYIYINKVSLFKASLRGTLVTFYERRKYIEIVSIGTPPPLLYSEKTLIAAEERIFNEICSPAGNIRSFCIPFLPEEIFVFSGLELAHPPQTLENDFEKTLQNLTPKEKYAHLQNFILILQVLPPLPPNSLQQS